MRLLRWLQLLILESRAYVLLSEIDHGEGLKADHERRLANSRQELKAVNEQIETVKRRGLLDSKPERLIREAA